MPAEQSFPAPVEFVRNAERYFAALAAHANPEESLGGSLLYAGSLDDDTRALVAAANVTGAATLVVAADTAAQKQAARDGIADFLVTSLDEALRILKNEIRKRATVAVCVAASSAELEREMLERGVVPDLVSADVASLFPAARAIETCPVHDPAVRIEWSVSTAPALWMPKLDEIARACLPIDNAAAHRWLRLAPRYCGRAAMSLRVLRCPSKIADEFSARIAAGIVDGSIGVPIEVRITAD
ncbi:MAG TPA: hypothetical protein VN151_07825 [Terracidiphilus sp.]|nr:hypothetical protein [Terracidiphilus sp.]